MRGGGTMEYTVAKTQSWLTPSIISGNCSLESDIVYLNVDASGLVAGDYSDTVTVTAADASGSPQTVALSLHVDAIELDSPNGGETLIVGDTETISWDSALAATVKIELLSGGSVVRTIDSGTANDGSFEWTVPTDVADGTNYRIRVSTNDSAGYDDSDADFSIMHRVVSYDMSSDPGWSLGDGWAYGQPTGGGGAWASPRSHLGLHGPERRGIQPQRRLPQQHVGVVCRDGRNRLLGLRQHPRAVPPLARRGEQRV